LRSEVFNNSIGSPYEFNYPVLTKEEDRQILAGLFEQLLIFDKIMISTNRLNFALFFLINRLGINTTERLFENGYINLMIWTPVIITGGGRQCEDGSIDESVIYSQPPISAGSLASKDIDPEENIAKALSHFNINRDRRRIFSRQISKNYVIPNGMEFSTDSAKFIIDAYQNNNFATIGLPYEKEPNELELAERHKLLNLGHKVLETAILSKYNLKSYGNYEHYEIFKQNLNQIGKAYNVSENTSQILKLENLPNLKALYLNDKLNFDDVFTLRHLSNAKFYRHWINNIGENSDAKEITKEYLNEIKGSTKYFDTNGGKLLRTLGIFGMSTTLGAVIGGPIGAAAGLGLSLFDTFLLENILKGRNPSMFIDAIRQQIEREE